MGRPRKRRREEAGAEPEGVSAILQNNGNDNALLDMPAAHAQCFNSSLGLASPPEHAGVPSGNEVYAQAQIDPSLAGLYGPQPPLSSFDFNLTPAIDPSLWDATTPNPTPPSAPSPNGPCTCLSLTYLTLTDLQTVPTFSFPQVIIPLRRAMSSVSSLLHCPTCPQDPFSAIQNVASLASLFKAIISRFAEVLGEVDREAASLRATGAKKPFRIGDLNPALQHLHTGTLDCPMGFNVELEPDVWVKLVKQALRTEMFGGGSNATPLERDGAVLD
ncbi:hypothetical protein E8E13_000546 [Curvularia kusanoi]|uniref:Uncharacterized protein n=1 Tax=Curvularia kusanoi TaxID=90978 RepID=A0A9P4T3E3_CURKU|nr:hypothetical protein E8E13_000546 [Curvularia kusanoi]